MPNPPKNKVVSLAERREANQLANNSLGAHLRLLAKEADDDKLSNIVMAWTMADGTIHSGYSHFEQTDQEWEDRNLRLLGLCKVVEGTLVDTLTSGDS